MTNEGENEPGATKREGDAAATTREQAPNGPDTPIHSLLSLPPALSERFEIIRELHTRGNEADLLMVRNRQDGKSVVIKLYRRGIEPKPEVMALLAKASHDFVVKQLEHGSSGGRAFEVMELAEGTLTDLLVEHKDRSLTLKHIFFIVQELAGSLSYLHALAPPVIHRDLKPDNILMRTRRPLKLVLTDFGIASILEHGSRVASSLNRTELYAAPEAGAGDVSAGLDWWSLGMIVVEAASGQHPFAGVAQRAIDIHYVNRRPIPLEKVADPWVKLLCQGLLCYDQKQRWGQAEVRRWLNNDRSLAAPEDSKPRGEGGDRASSAYRIGSAECWTLKELAADFAANWEEAVKRFARRSDIQRWLDEALHDQNALNRFIDLQDDKAYQPLDGATKLSLWLAELDPSLPLIAAGRVLSPATFLDFLGAAEADKRTWPMILRPEYAGMLAKATGAQWLADIYTKWQQAGIEARGIDTALLPGKFDIYGHFALLRMVIDEVYRETVQRKLGEIVKEPAIQASPLAGTLLTAAGQSGRKDLAFGVAGLSPVGLWVASMRIDRLRESGKAVLAERAAVDAKKAEEAEEARRLIAAEAKKQKDARSGCIMLTIIAIVVAAGAYWAYSSITSWWNDRPETRWAKAGEDGRNSEILQGRQTGDISQNETPYFLTAWAPSECSVGTYLNQSENCRLPDRFFNIWSNIAPSVRARRKRLMESNRFVGLVPQLAEGKEIRALDVVFAGKREDAENLANANKTLSSLVGETMDSIMSSGKRIKFDKWMSGVGPHWVEFERGDRLWLVAARQGIGFQSCLFKYEASHKPPAEEDFDQIDDYKMRMRLTCFQSPEAATP